MNQKETKKVLRTIVSVYDYAKVESSESKKNREYILKKMELSAENFDFDKLEEYTQFLHQYAIKIIESFKKEDIIFLTEFIREQYCFNEFPEKMLYFYMRITEVAIYIQKIALQKKRKFKEVGNFNRNRLCELIEILFMYDEIKIKSEYAINNNYRCSFEELFLPLSDNEIEEFFEQYDLYFRVKKPEERKVYDNNLKKYLERKKLTPERIYKDADIILKEILGFTYTDIDNIVKYIDYKINIENLKEKCLYGEHHVKIKKDKFYELFKEIISIENLNSLVEFLSLNRCIERNLEISNRMLELRCIIEDDEKLSFGLCNLKECLLILKVISISGHYPKEIGIQEEQNKKFTEFQSRLTKYFSYLVGDLMQHYGFKLPIGKNGLIKVDLNTIKLSNKKLNFKDIDVLALDYVNKRLYNCELKYFKVKMNYKSIKTDALEEKKFKNFLDRQKQLEENKEQILKEIFGVIDTDGYSIIPVVITSRVNHNTKQIIEYSFEEFRRKIINKEII